MRMIRVVIIHQDGLITGSAISLMNMLKGINQDEFKINVILAGDGPLKHRIEDLGFSVNIVQMLGFWTAPGPRWYRRGTWLNLRSLFQRSQIVNAVREYNPDIIHINDKAMLPAGLALKKLNIPIVQHLRSTYFSTNTRLFARLSQRIISGYATALIGISEDEIFEFPTFPKKFVVYNSMDFRMIDAHKNARSRIRQEFQIGDEDTLITYVGQFSKTKGAWDFIDMLSGLARLTPFRGLRFMMVGHLPTTSRKTISRLFSWGAEDSSRILRKKLSQDNISGRVILTGFRSDVLDIMAASDIMVICNRLGALGRQAFEAMALGKPLVVTKGHSGHSTIVVNGETALMVPQANPMAMAKAVNELLVNRDQGKRLGANAEVYARNHFDHRNNARKIEDIYRLLLKERNG